jgi:hypothetical protein
VKSKAVLLPANRVGDFLWSLLIFETIKFIVLGEKKIHPKNPNVPIDFVSE